MQGAPPLAHLGPAAELHLQAAVPSARSGSRGRGRPGIDLHTQPHLSAAVVALCGQPHAFFQVPRAFSGYLAVT